jgi:hypothetical protein
VRLTGILSTGALDGDELLPAPRAHPETGLPLNGRKYGTTLTPSGLYSPVHQVPCEMRVVHFALCATAATLRMVMLDACIVVLVYLAAVLFVHARARLSFLVCWWFWGAFKRSVWLLPWPACLFLKTFNPQHFFVARLDMAVDGLTNTVVEVDCERSAVDDARNPWRNAFFATHTVGSAPLTFMTWRSPTAPHARLETPNNLPACLFFFDRCWTRSKARSATVRPSRRAIGASSRPLSPRTRPTSGPGSPPRWGSQLQEEEKDSKRAGRALSFLCVCEWVSFFLFFF